MFFASADRFVASFDYKEVIERVHIDVTRAHFWDITAVNALDRVVVKFRREGTDVDGDRAQRGQRDASWTASRVHDKADDVELAGAH